MMQWYYTVRGENTARGLADETALSGMARDGRLKPSDLVWNRDTGTRWVSASTIEGLFPAGEPAAESAEPAPAALPVRPRQELPATRVEQQVPSVPLPHADWEGRRARPQEGGERASSRLIAAVIVLCVAVGLAVPVVFQLYSAVRSNNARLASRMPEAETALLFSNAAAALQRSEMAALVEQANLCLEEERLEEAGAFIAELGQYDTDGQAVAYLTARMNAARGTIARRRELEKALRDGALDGESARELVQIYQARGRETNLESLIGDTLRNRETLTSGASLAAARVCLVCGRYDMLKTALAEFVDRSPMSGAEDGYIEAAGMYCAAGEPLLGAGVLEKFLENVPENSSAWLELAAIRSEAGDTAGAMKALRAAVRYGNDDARGKAVKDERFNSLRDDRSFRRLVEIK